jgi:putative inorganic carbon (hco3(-)) transporter
VVSKSRVQRPRAHAGVAEAQSSSLDDVYGLKPGAIWSRLKQEPLHFWLFCGYLFFEYFRAHNIFPIIDVLPWPRIFILGALFSVLFDSRESKDISGPLTFPVLGFFSIVFISCIFAFSPSRSLDQIPVAINWILVYLLFLLIVNTKFRLFIAFMILLLASFKMAQHGFRVGLSRGFGYAGWGVQGPQGYFQNAADLGVQMAIYTPWAIAFYFGLRKYWDYKIIRWLFIFAPVAGVATAISTGQRNTTLAFFAMALAFVVFSKNRIRNFFLVAMGAVIALSLASDEFKERFETMGTDQTSENRLIYWERGIEFYKNNPVIGVGYENWTLYYAANYPGQTFSMSGGYEVAHSVPITVAGETGTLGLFLYYLVVLVILVTNLRSARLLKSVAPAFWRHLAISLNYGVVGFLAAGIFLSIAYYPFLWFQAGLTASLYGIALRENRAALPRPSRRSNAPRLLHQETHVGDA